MKVHKAHRKLTLRTRIVKKISDIPHDDWKGVYPDILESYHYYKTIDESGFDQFSFFYMLVYDKKKVIAATPCFIVNYSLDTSINGSLRHLSNLVKKFAPNIFSLKAVVCGMPLGQGKIGMRGEPDKILKAIVRRLEQIAKKNRAPIVAFKDFDENYTGTLDRLKLSGFVKFDSLPLAEMELRFNNFDDYLKTLSGASRYDLKRKFKKVDGCVKIDMEIVDALSPGALDEVYALYLQMVDKHEMGFELVPKSFFANISKNMPGKAKFFLWRIDGKIAAFLFSLVSKDVMLDYYLGLDYALAHKYHLYFVKFRDAMNWCIANNIKRYDMGVTGYEPKKRLGFDFTPLYLYAKYRNSLMRPFFKTFSQFLKFENFDPVLKEIKKDRNKKMELIKEKTCSSNR